MAKKTKSPDDFIHHLYVHMSEVDQFVIFSGITLKQFFASIGPLTNLLLLKHRFEDGAFNMHTMFDYVTEQEIVKFVKEMDDIKDDLCWIDFVDEQKVNELSPREIAELLYISHKREPITSPFFQKLKNRFVYYSSNNDKMTKIYFRNLDDCDYLVSSFFNNLIKDKVGNISFWKRKTKKNIPSIDGTLLKSYRSYAKDGVLLSLFKMEKPENSFGLELRTLMDYDFPDEVWDDLDKIIKRPFDELIEIQ